MKLLLSCSELGLGHVSRIRLLGRKLKERGHKLWFFSGGLAYSLLKKEFEYVHYATPVSWYETAQGIKVSASIPNILFPLPWFDFERRKLNVKKPNSEEIIRRYYDLRRNIKQIKPDIIISDGDVVALRLALRWRIPSIFITNVIRPTANFPLLLIPGQRLTEKYIRKATKIIVPDIPRYTICEYNLGNLHSIGIEDKVEFVGSFFDTKLQDEQTSEEFIFASISGPMGTRAKVAREVIPVLSKLDKNSLVSLGEPESKFTKKIGHCRIHGWLPSLQREESMKNARTVIFSGGHGTCFEVLGYRKPSICIPTQPEQKANAKKLAELGCSIFVENGNELGSAIHKIESERESFKSNVFELSRFCRRFQGLDATISLIETLSI